MTKPFVRQLFTGKVKRMGDPNATNSMDKPWESGIFKTETGRRTWAGETGLIGDEIADKKNHGGPEKAIFAYPIKHYDDWKKDLNLNTIDIGGMGENLAVVDMDESSVCMGIRTDLAMPCFKSPSQDALVGNRQEDFEPWISR
ncbi:MOSC domain-containing protein [Salicibibacter kimchii]|uniref:MOSC domain-containing protein n=1 Tax=Salicibibacter kimchii TaxID=2099786 RepID=A0A345C0H7_9BACI|nr:MOSC domain-containing protein [Salicibibacter kimchii]AXF56708.1 MOSC domain-containing protein [Salicibibacter kimchii]